MRAAVKEGGLAALAAALVALFACAPPPQKAAAVISPPPSPSATPTAPLQASSPPFHGGEVGVAYAAVVLPASGGAAPYTWSVSSGALPAGLVLAKDGLISGTPTSAGNFSFTAQVTDAGDTTATISGAIAIAPALSAKLIPSCSQYCRVELGCSSACGAFGQQSGGSGPYTYSLTQGQLPAGTTLNGLSLNGTFKGVSGWLQFTVQIADAFGATASIAPKFWMYDHISLASGTCAGNYLTGCTANLVIGGGVPGTARSVRLVSVAPNPNQGCWSPSATAPPAGYGLSVSGGNVVVSIPNHIINGYGAVWTLQLDEQTACATGTDCTSNQATVVIGVQCG